MVRSGCVSRRLRAASPTTMLPSESRLTTDGHNVLPYGPGIHFGWPVWLSVYATRLFVVPRSMPTMRPIPTLYLSQFLSHVDDQIANVRAAIQQFVQAAHDFLARGVVRVSVNSEIPIASSYLKLGIDFA